MRGFRQTPPPPPPPPGGRMIRGAGAAGATPSAAFRGGGFGGGLATQRSPSACSPPPHFSGQTRLLIERTAFIASDETALAMLTDVSLTNWLHAALVSSLNSPFTSLLTQPTRCGSNCSDRASSCGSGVLVAAGGGGTDDSSAIRCSASPRCALSGNRSMNLRS